MAQVPFGHVILAAEDVAVGRIDGGAFLNPVVKVGRTDRKRVAIEDRGNSHGAFAAIRKSVKADALGINKRKRLQPIQDLLVLANNRGKEGAAERIRFS